MPDLARHFEAQSVDLEIYTVKWFFTLFTITLPFEYCLQVIDLYLLEQSAVLVRLSLTVLYMLRKKLLSATAEQMHEILKQPF